MINPGIFKSLSDPQLQQYAMSGKPGSVMAIDELGQRQRLRSSVQVPVQHSTVEAQQGFASGGLVDGGPSDFADWWYGRVNDYWKNRKKAFEESPRATQGGGSVATEALHEWFPRSGLDEAINGPPMPRSPYAPELTPPPVEQPPNMGGMSFTPPLPAQMPVAQVPAPVVAAPAGVGGLTMQDVLAMQGGVQNPPAPNVGGLSAAYLAEAQKQREDAKWLSLLQAGGTIMSSPTSVGAAVGAGIQSGVSDYGKRMADYQRALGDVMQIDQQSAAMTQRWNESNADRAAQLASQDKSIAAAAAMQNQRIAADKDALASQLAAQKDVASIRTGPRGDILAKARKDALEFVKEARENGAITSPEDMYRIYNNKVQEILQQYISTGVSAEDDSSAVDISDK